MIPSRAKVLALLGLLLVTGSVSVVTGLAAL